VSEEEKYRLTTTGETVAAGGVAVSLALLFGVEILDAGAMSSALLVGAAASWLAENENEYGVGGVARGLGTIGKTAVGAAMAANEK
jgi:hypothetical protein